MVSCFMHNPSEVQMKAIFRNLRYLNKKQKVVSLSSIEVEYRAMVKGIQELLQLKRLVKELDFLVEGTMKLYHDNQFAIKIAENPIQHDRTRDIEIDCNFIY
ncbi:Copia protein, partial [Mucuna pruriens]